MSHLQFSGIVDVADLHLSCDHDSKEKEETVYQGMPSCRLEEMDEKEIRSCMNVLIKLQTTKDDGVAMQALTQIKEDFSNGTYKQYFINQHVHISVLSALKNFESQQEVQSICLELLDTFLEESDILHKNIINQSDLYRYVVKFLDVNIDKEAEMIHGMNVLSKLLKNVNIQYQISMDNETSHIYQLLIKVMTSYSEDLKLLVPTLISLQGILIIDSSLHKTVIKDHLALMMSFLDKHQNDKDVMISVFKVFVVTGQDEEVRTLLINEGIHERITEELTPVKEEVDYKCACCALLDTLCQEDDVCVQLVTNEFVDNLLIPLMVNIPGSVSIQCNLLRIFKKLAQLTFETEVSSETEQNVCIVIYQAMFRHIDSPQIQIDGCHGISALLENRPEAHQWIGENANEDTREIPLHTACLGSILMYNTNIQVYRSACEAFYWLAADNERICVNLMEKNAHMAVIDGLRLHLSDNLSVVSACRALRGICIFHEKHKQSVVAEGALSLLTTLLTTYSDKEEVQNEIISTLACLADIDIVRYQCFIENVPLKILNCMKKYSDNVLLQEAGLECLCVMSGAEDGTQCLNAVGTFRIVIDILNKHQNCIYIQKKGLMLLQLLAEPSICSDRSLCKGLSKVLANAMKDNFHDDSILQEACVLVQIYAEMGKEMSKHFVQEGCHDLLFSIMEHHDDNTDLQDIASECLCVLSLEHDLKSNMLLSACSNGIVAGVDCLLEIGADVNFGQGQDTPLCHAVRCQNEHLVKLLLKQGVIDSHLHTALMISLKLSNHQITGLLLASITKSSDGDVSHITWSGLELPDIRPEWFVGDLSEQITRHGSDTGKYITKKIKESHRRRSSTTSLHYSESDSKLVLLRKRKQFRFRNDRKFNSDLTDDSSDFRGIMRSTPDKSDNSYSDTLGIPRLLLPDDGVGGLSRTRDRERLPSAAGLLSPITSPVGSPTSTSSVFDDVFPMSDESVKFYLSESQNSSFYEFSSKEIEEWKTSTLTGANIPISPSDPRFRRKASIPDQSTSQSMWMRKSSRSPSPRLSLKIGETSFISDGFQGKSRAPVVVFSSDVERSQKIGPDKIRKRWHSGPAQINPGSASGTEDVVYSQMDLNRRRPSVESVLYYRHQHLNSGKISSTESFLSDTDSNRSSYTSKDQLKLLDISCNIITSLSHLAEAEQTMKKVFSHLVKLYLNDNLIEEIPDAVFKDLHHLELLDLKENKLSIFPSAALEHCKALISLDLSSNKISEVECKHKHDILQELHLSNNTLVVIPEHLCQHLPNLRVLSLTSNEIKVLPDKSLGLKNLKKLYLSHNKINKIPEVFLQDCKELDTLEAANNALESLPSESIATSLQLLNRVKLMNNSLTEKEPFYVPKFLLELQSLRVIDLSENGLFGLPPPSMWKTQMLKELHASKNYITKLNLEGVTSWSKLETMHLSHNQIHELPKEVGALKSLTSLDMSYNSQLTTLPDELGNCSEMWELPLIGLDLDLDRSLLKGNVKDLIAFLHNKHKKAIEYYRLKMMVVGFGGRGKTTLLQALMKKYKAKNINTATVGVIVKTWKFERFRADLRKTVTYTISTWDFAGQEEFYSTHQCYLSNRALYLVVYDIRKGPKEMELLKPWLANIHARAPGCPVIVVGTHLDAISEDKQEAAFNKIHNKLSDLSNAYSGFPEMHVAAPVDCTKENIGMEKLRNLIKDVIDNYKVRGKAVMGQMKPASYVKLSDLLAEELKNTLETYPVITHSNLLKIVQNASLGLDETELQQAVRFLHESGVLLHYDDSTLHLRELYFIDPGWLCRMMAQVVTVPQINPFIKNGILRKNDVRLLFTGKKLEENFIFPKSLIPQYLKLLEKFEIALPYSEEELLIPSRLPEKVPEFNVPNLKKDEKICRYYIMPHVPLGLWSRLITRMIVFSKSVVIETLMELQTPCIPEMYYWKTGIFVSWTQTSFFLLSSCITDKEEIQITVPATKNGCLLLGQVVDHLDALIDEWYPGLTSVDPLQGRHLLEKYAPCVYCEDSDQSPYLFLLDDLLKQTEGRLEVECPQHGGVIPLSLLAPDLVLSDLDSGLQLDVSQFDLVESPENLLGDGGYGAVYKAKYKNQLVAVKMFNAIGDIHPHVMLRQEATVLRCLKHPSVVSLLAVGVQPRIIVLELALKGSLSKVLRTEEHKKDLSRTIQHRIASQVAEGLVYLHKLMIIYRDLKPDNVLIFSTVPNSMINAKISDYGIARFSTLDGLVAQEGTPAYRAPEVIRGETYSFKADVFSYGITIYSLLTGGKHPFFEYEFNSEMDRAISEATTFPTITQRGCPPWSDMQNIISRCLDQFPDKRPESKEILNQLMSPESLCLRQWVPVSIETTVECMAFQVQDKELHGGKHLNLWIGSGDSEYVQLSHFNLMDPTMEAKGAMFRYGRILCLQPLSQGFLLIGTQMCKIWVYDTLKHEFRHCTRLLPDAVITMKFISGHDTDDLIIVGLANGMIAVFPVSEILYEPNSTPMCLSPGKKHESIRCMEVRKRRIFASCGSKVVVISTRRSIFIEKTFDTCLEKPKKSSRSIYTMAVGANRIYLSHKGSSVIQMWEVTDVKKHKNKRNEIQEKLRDSIDVAVLFNLHPVSARVTSMILQNDVLWVGTGSGSIALVDLNTKQPITISNRYTSAVRSLMYISCQEPAYKAVLSGGIGFKDNPNAHVNEEDECGCVAVWEADFADQTKKLKDYTKSRQNLVNSYI